MFKKFAASLFIIGLAGLPGAADVMDFGDAPDSPVNTYPSLNSNDGARHSDASEFYLGDGADLEFNSAQVDLDNYDDGFDEINFLAKVRNDSWGGWIFLNALIDINKDGDWEDPFEWLVQNAALNVPQGAYLNYPLPISNLFFIPGVNLDATWIRLTVTAHPILNYTGKGKFKYGETEDYYFVPIILYPPPGPVGPIGSGKGANGGPGGGGGGGGAGSGVGNGGGGNGGGGNGHSNGGGRTETPPRPGKPITIPPDDPPGIPL